MDYKVLSRRMQYQLDLPTVVCRSCGFVFSNPIPAREVYSRFYVDAYASYYGRVAARPDGAAGQVAPPYIRSRLDQIGQHAELGKSILLEVGPGPGLFLHWAQRRGCVVFGLEPSIDFYLSLVEQNIPCANASLEEIDPAGLGSFDILVMLHVLEHFYDPNQALQICRELLKPDGILVLEVPNILKPFRSLDRYFLRYVHLSSFSPNTLSRMLVKHGFNVLYGDQRGDGWKEPQNLFVIARKLDGMRLEPGTTGDDPDQVIEQLRYYRFAWRLWKAPVWYSLMMYYRMRRSVYRSGRRIKSIIRASKG